MLLSNILHILYTYLESIKGGTCIENVELINIYKILLSIQQDIHKLDKKVDNIDMRLTKLEQRLEDVQAEMLKEIQRTKSANIERF